MKRLLKEYTFNDFTNFCLKQNPRRKISMKDTSADAFLGDVLIQFGRAFYKRKIVGIGNTAVVFAKEYIANPVREDYYKMYTFNIMLQEQRVTDYETVQLLIKTKTLNIS